jgi:hypothetical protein
VGQAPADLHPPLSKTKVAKVVVEVRTRASEAKGPFPGGKRVGSWELGEKEEVKKKAKEKRKTPTQRSLGLEGIDKRVGSSKKKQQKRK